MTKSNNSNKHSNNHNRHTMAVATKPLTIYSKALEQPSVSSRKVAQPYLPLCN